MSSYEDYTVRRDKVTGLLRDGAAFFGRYEDTASQAGALLELAEHVEKNVFSIVLVGEFSAGKSTFLNALMHRRLLPSFTGETTATVNFLMDESHSQQGEGGRVYYNDGREELIPECTLETIEEFVSTRGSREAAKKIERVELYLSSGFLKDGVLLVDSPGLNGVADHHREITERQVLRSHACIFMFSADHPGSKTDFQYLHQLKSKVSTILFVLNKIDGIKRNEGETVESIVDSLKKTYHEKFPEETTIPEIWPVAAYPALVARSPEKLDYQNRFDFTPEMKEALEENSRMKTFEERLWRFLTNGEKTKQQLLSPVERAQKMAAEYHTDLQARLDALQSEQSAAEVEEKMKSLEEEKTRLENESATFKAVIMEKLSVIRRDVLEEASAGAESKRERSLKNVDQQDDLETLNEYFVTFPKRFIADLQSLAGQLDERMEQELSLLTAAEYQKYFSEVQDRLVKLGGMTINLTVDLDKTEVLYSVGLEAFAKEREAKEREIRALDERLESKELDEIKAKRAELERQNLQQKLDNEELALRTFQETIGSSPLPGVERRSEEHIVEKKRKGILGVIANVFVGPREVPEYWTVIDDDNYQNVKKQRDNTEKEYSARIEMLREKNASLPPGNSADEFGLQIRRLQAEYDEQRRVLRESMAQFTQEAKQKNAKAIRQAKSRLGDYCEDAASDFIKQISRALIEKQNLLAQMLGEIVGANILAQLNSVKAHLEKLEQELSTEGQKRMELIETLQSARDEMRVFLSHAAEVETELECIQTDKIQETVL